MIQWKSKEVQHEIIVTIPRHRRKAVKEGEEQETFKVVPVPFLVDVPNGEDSVKIRRGAMASRMFETQLEAALTSATTRWHMFLENISNDTQLASKKMPTPDYITIEDPDEKAAAHKKYLEEEREAIKAFGDVDYFNVSIFDDVKKLDEKASEARTLLNEVAALVVKHIVDIVRRDPEDPTIDGAPLEINGQAWKDMSPEDRYETALRMPQDFLAPLIGAVAEGASQAYAKK